MTGVLAMWLMACIPLFFWAGCPCCGQNFCERCFDDAMAQWSLTLALPDCTGNFDPNLDGTYVLTRNLHSGSFCIWRYSNFSGAPTQITLRFDTGAESIELLINENSSQFARYFLTVDPSTLPCDEPIELPLDSTASSGCPGIWPATLTVNPHP